MMFLIKANVTKRVSGISGAFKSVEGKLVNAINVDQAKAKFERSIRDGAANMQCDTIDFEYLEVFNEIG